jgi:hypothetical protein
MKFMVLDDNIRAQARAADAPRYKEAARHNTHYSDSYQHLDELFDKTFITDYFMDRSAAAGVRSEK